MHEELIQQSNNPSLPECCLFRNPIGVGPDQNRSRQVQTPGALRPLRQRTLASLQRLHTVRLPKKRTQHFVKNFHQTRHRRISVPKILPKRPLSGPQRAGPSVRLGLFSEFSVNFFSASVTTSFLLLLVRHLLLLAWHLLLLAPVTTSFLLLLVRHLLLLAWHLLLRSLLVPPQCGTSCGTQVSAARHRGAVPH